MSARTLGFALAFMVVAVVLQTTLLADARVRPFGVAVNLVVLVVIGVVRYLDPEPAILLGFTAGILVDLLGATPLGVWGMVMTTVAFVTLSIRDRGGAGGPIVGLGVFLLTLLAGVLFVLMSLIFGVDTLQDPSVWKKVVLPAFYNLALAAALLPLLTKLLREKNPRRWAA